MRSRLLQVASARHRTVRPRDAPQAFVAGRDCIRILVAGSGPVAGWGVSTHDLALPGAVARAVAASTGRGAVVDVIAESAAGVRGLSRVLRAKDVSRYDAVVVSVTLTDALRRSDADRWGRKSRRLLERLRAEGPLVAWLGSQPIRSVRAYDNEFGELTEEYAQRLNDEGRRMCDETPGARFVPLPAPPLSSGARHRTPADYLLWGRHVADALLVLLASSDADRPRDGGATGSDGSTRADAIAALRLTERAPDERFNDLVETARRTLGSDVALFSVLDDVRQWHFASTGTSLTEVPIEQSVCLHTIQTADGLVIPDAERDPRFADYDLVNGPSHLRFYAGYPVEAPDGTRIGAICVFGRTARDPDESDTDLDVLRELALLAQRELWRWQPAVPSR